jgi:phage I-like protein/cation transport regulator ChaB
MPYRRLSDLPGRVKRTLPAAAQTIWLHAYNKALTHTKESRRLQLAWASVQRAGYVEGSDGTWQLLTRAPEHTEDLGPAIAIAIHDAQPEKAPEWVEVVPAGKFVGADGRGPYRNASPQAVIDRTKAEMVARGMTGGIPIDYDHATDFSERGRAEAAGWMRDFEVRDGAIWAHVEWTPEGATRVAHKHYKYLSPVFEHTKDDQQLVMCLLRAALTNNPNLTLTAVAAARRSTMAKDGVGNLSDKIKALEKVFPDMGEAELLELTKRAVELAGDDDGDTGEPDGDELPEVVAREGHAETCTDETCQGQCLTAAHEDEETMVAETAAALHAGEGEPTEDEITAARRVVQAHQRRAREHAAKEKQRMSKGTIVVPAALKAAFPNLSTQKLAILHAAAIDAGDTPEDGTAKDELIKSLNSKVVNLETKDARREAETKVTAAMRFPHPKISPAMKDWAIDYAMRDSKGFDAYLKTAPVIMARTPEEIRQPPAPGTVAQLDARTLEICRNTGVKPEDFAAHYAKTKDTPGTGAAMMAAHAGR